MRKKNRIPLPVIVDDFSPSSGYLESRNFDSIDLARSSVPSLDLRDDEENDLVPNLEVIEELESIRGMIENKSRDLRVRELSLSQSISKWNSDIFESHKLIEELSENLIDVGQKRLQDSFLKHELAINTLIEKLNLRIKKYEEITRRFKSNLSADRPPVPTASVTDGVIQHDQILKFLSVEPYSSSRCTAVASALLVCSRSLSSDESDFVLNSFINSTCDILRARFTNYMIQSCSSEVFRLGSDESSRSRFMLKKHSFLCKRLGVVESSTGPVDIILDDTSVGVDRVVDVTSELQHANLIEMWKSGFQRGSFPPVSKPLVRMFADSHVQGSVSGHLRSKISLKDLRCKIVDGLINPFDESKVSDILAALRRDIESKSNHSELKSGFVIILILFLVYRCLEDGLPSLCATQLNETIQSFQRALSTKSYLNTSLSSWGQGLWFIVATVVLYKGDMNNIELVTSLLDLLEHVDSLKSLMPWKDVILDRLGKNLVHTTLVGRVKGLLKRFDA